MGLINNYRKEVVEYQNGGLCEGPNKRLKGLPQTIDDALECGKKAHVSLVTDGHKLYSEKVHKDFEIGEPFLTTRSTKLLIRCTDLDVFAHLNIHRSYMDIYLDLGGENFLTTQRYLVTKNKNNNYFRSILWIEGGELDASIARRFFGIINDGEPSENQNL